MRKLFLSVLIALGFCQVSVPADAWMAQKSGTVTVATGQVLMTLYEAALSASADKILPIGYGPSNTVSSTDTLPYTYFPVAGTISGIYGRFSSAPSSTANSYSMTILKNGSALSPSVTCTVQTTGLCNSTNSFSVAAGDLISMKLSPVGNPSTVGRISYSVLFTPTNANDTVIFSQIPSVTLTNGVGAIVGPFSNYTTINTTSRTHITIPDDGVVDKLYAMATTPPTTGNSYTIAFDKLGSSTALTTSIADTATVASPDLTHTVSVSGPTPTGASCAAATTVGGCTYGNYVAFRATAVNSPASATIAYSARYVPSTTGSYAIMSMRTADNTASTIYYGMSTSSTGNTTETNVQTASAAQTITKIAAKVDIAPGAGKSRTYTLRKNGADTALACSIADTATACSLTLSPGITVNDNDVINTSMAPSGTPATSVGAVSYLAHR